MKNSGNVGCQNNPFHMFMGPRTPRYLRNDIKSCGKFVTFSIPKIERGWVKRANLGKIETKDRDY